MNDPKSSTGKDNLVVEILGAHNLMPKDGEGSSSPFVEVEFENQRLRTQVRYKELNPIWNQKLVFHVTDIADLPYRTIEINVFNEKRSSSSRNFLGKVRISGSSIAKQGEEVVQFHTLEKRSLFSHVRGELSLKLFVAASEVAVEETGRVAGSGLLGSKNPTVFPKKNKKVLQQNASMVVPQHQKQQNLSVHDNKNKKTQHGQFQAKPTEPDPNDLKPVVITTVPGPAIPVAGACGGVPGGGGMNVYSNGSGEFSLKETKPHLGGDFLNKDKTSSTYDLVEQMQYLYVRVVKAKDISVLGEFVSEVKLGNYRGVSKRVGSINLEWDQVFAFSKDCIQSSFVEIFVKESNKDDFLGRVLFDLNEVQKRVPPDSQLAPQWYRMEDRKGQKSRGEVMVSIWFGTQADEAFAEAWHSKAANVHFDGLCSIKSKVYLSPKLWYLRVSVIEAQDIVPSDKGSPMMRFPELSAKVQVGDQVLRTRSSGARPSRSFSNPYWSEDLMFVVAEPFEDYVMVTVQDRVAAFGRDEVLGRVLIPVSAVERRTDDKPVVSRWFNLDNHSVNPNEPSKPVTRFGSRIHLRVSLDGGYHVLDEATVYSSDVKLTAKPLWKANIGVLEIGILGATDLMPMKIKEGKGGSTDAYCVAKYGQKWVRTRTVVDSLSPKWNEQYTWEVFDPCTVITIGVFDNSRIEKTNGSVNTRDARIGKVRIRLSTLETDRVYTHSYPLLILHNTGIKKTGELHLAVRFTCTNMVNILHMYTSPVLPKMHYVHPLGVNQLESLRYQATNVVTGWLSRAEPPLGREVVEYMLDHDSHRWSMRRSKANFFRLVNVISGVVAAGKWIESMRSWKTPVYSAVFVTFFLVMVMSPELIMPCSLLYLACVGLWRYRSRPRHPPHTDARISNAESVFPDELDEEFDSFPASRAADLIRMRYDRLRSIAGRIQAVVGDAATQGERLQALLSWRDPRATFLFVVFCLFAAVGFYVVPGRVAVAILGLYWLRPPRFRRKLPSRGLSFFRRLPSKADILL